MKKQITYSEKYGPAMEIAEQAAADAYFEECVLHHMSFGKGVTRDKAEQIERANLGYWAGYYDDATRARVERLFDCAHPIFGSITKNGAPTTEQALAAGIAAGKANPKHQPGQNANVKQTYPNGRLS